MTPSIQVKIKCDTWHDGERCPNTATVEVELQAEYAEDYRTGRFLIEISTQDLPDGWTSRWGSARCPEHDR